MNKKIVASMAILIPLMFSQTVFADSESLIVNDLDKQLTKADLLASTQDYVTEEIERPQARRSALFAHILDTMAKNATMAKLDKISSPTNS